MMSSLPLGASRAVESERLRAARELDLARTIEAIDAVQAARVHLALEAPSAFLRERAKPAASVMLTLQGGRALSDSQVQAIVNLVASSVPGMSPDGVSVADQNGRLLSSRSTGGLERGNRPAGAGAGADRGALSPIDRGAARADPGRRQLHRAGPCRRRFLRNPGDARGLPKDASTLRTEEGAVSTDGSGRGRDRRRHPRRALEPAPGRRSGRRAPDGALTPAIPGAPTDASAAKRNENYVRNYAVGREVSITRAQTGSVKRLSVAVALNNPEGAKPRSPQDIAALEKLVKGAVGFDAARGDVVALSARSFAPVAQTEPAWWEAGWVAMLARNLTALVVAGLVIFGIAKPLMKRGGAALAKRAEAQVSQRQAVSGEIAAAIASQATNDPNARVTLDMIESAHSYETRAALIRSFVRQDPARAALVVRDLIRSDSAKEEKNG
jgi:flagellar M-ring protein FliF